MFASWTINLQYTDAAVVTLESLHPPLPHAQMSAYGYANGYGDPNWQWTLRTVRTPQLNVLALELNWFESGIRLIESLRSIECVSLLLMIPRIRACHLFGIAHGVRHRGEIRATKPDFYLNYSGKNWSVKFAPEFHGRQSLPSKRFFLWQTPGITGFVVHVCSNLNAVLKQHWSIFCNEYNHALLTDSNWKYTVYIAF